MSLPKLILTFFITLMLSVTLKAQDDALRLKQFNLKDGLAMGGYDATSYFGGKPVKGKKTFVAKYKSVLYQFASQENLDKFKSNASKYEPAYGGWCAYAMGNSGEKVEVDPETYKIIDGKIYLFYNSFFNNTLTDWNKNETALKKKADANWTTFIKQ